MNKKIKIIDLLNKIANKEELPKKIEYKFETFYIKYDTFHDIYFYEAKDGTLLLKYIYNTNYLLDEVEILEDNTEEIEELAIINNYSYNILSKEEKIKQLKSYIENNRDKINELVRAVNELRKEKE